MMQFTIRSITQQDVPFLWETLYESLYVPEGQETFERDIIHDPFLAKYVEGWGREGDYGFIAMNSEDQPIGSITIRYFSEDQKGFGYVGDDVPELGMAILAAFRGEGIGTALMNKLFDYLKEMQVMKVSLSVAPNNMAAVNLYRRFGFTDVGMVDTSVTMVANL